MHFPLPILQAKAGHIPPISYYHILFSISLRYDSYTAFCWFLSITAIDNYLTILIISIFSPRSVIFRKYYIHMLMRPVPENGVKKAGMFSQDACKCRRDIFIISKS